jgi:hypothetical protein
MAVLADHNSLFSLGQEAGAHILGDIDDGRILNGDDSHSPGADHFGLDEVKDGRSEVDSTI